MPDARAPAASSAIGETAATLLRLDYDATGRASVTILGGPVVSWLVDPTTPTAAPIPIGLAPPPTPPPNTGAIQSPPWALSYGALISQHGHLVAVVATPDDSFIGTLPDFFTWLATNNGATRKLSARLGLPTMVNIWNLWARDNPDLVQ